MGLKQQIDSDLKQALLSGNKETAGTLRIIKSTILNEEIARGVRDEGLSDELIMQCLKKEAKKRQEAADLYKQAGSEDRAASELAEKAIVESYLPKQLSETEIQQLVDRAFEQYDGTLDNSALGKIIGEVRVASGGNADGAIIARLVKAKIS